MVQVVSEIPEPAGSRLFGHALALRDDLLGTLVRLYREHGPVFRLRAMSRSFVVLAGVEANLFVARHEAECMTTEHHYGWFGRELGSERFLLALSGEEHRVARRLLRPGYSKAHVTRRMLDLAILAERNVRGFGVGLRRRPLDDMRRIVVDQLGLALGSRPAGHLAPDLERAVSTLLRVTVARSLPRIALWGPRFRRARARMRALVRSAIAEHRANRDGGRLRDHIDDLLDARMPDGSPLDPDFLEASAHGPFVAGLDTVASTLAIALYTLCRDPDLRGRLEAEADAVFAEGPPTAGSLMGAKLLHAALMETLRLHPVTPVVVRTTTVPIEFEGHAIPAGQDLLVAHCVPHMLETFYPDPEAFVPERFLPPREEHRARPGIYAPFAVGPHTCLGAGIADVLLMLDAAYLLHRFEIAVPPGIDRLALRHDPVAVPRNLALEIVRERNPAPAYVAAGLDGAA